MIENVQGLENFSLTLKTHEFSGYWEVGFPPEFRVTVYLRK